MKTSSDNRREELLLRIGKLMPFIPLPEYDTDLAFSAHENELNQEVKRWEAFIDRLESEAREKAIFDCVEEIEGDWALALGAARNGENLDQEEVLEYKAAVLKTMSNDIQAKFLKPKRK